MLDEILDFINKYCSTEEAIKVAGKYRTVSAGLSKLINEKFYTVDELRKELSKHLKRILSEKEFNRLLDYDRIEYEPLLHS